MATRIGRHPLPHPAVGQHTGDGDGLRIGDQFTSQHPPQPQLLTLRHSHRQPLRPHPLLRPLLRPTTRP
ncbi:hypothetical protein GXW82_44360 [Streptacidiphilus sp. 4-A2]|nr:hypothetical protein [Streptacidiphilus sp. 4-A2]